jgi:hypothetical protein
MIQEIRIPEIYNVKQHFDALKQKGLISEWELPYENILTRLTAAIFFFDAADESKLDEIWRELVNHPRFVFRLNEEKKLSKMKWRVEFNKDFTL